MKNKENIKYITLEELIGTNTLKWRIKSLFSKFTINNFIASFMWRIFYIRYKYFPWEIPEDLPCDGKWDEPIRCAKEYAQYKVIYG